MTGYRVLELGGKGPVPFATMMLADLGAEVTVCRRPNQARSLEGVDILARGKSFADIDLKSEQAKDGLLALAAEFDVVIEGFRPGTVERLGVGPAEFLGANPRIVYVRVSGYGQDNAFSRVAGHDLNFVAMAGALAHMGPANGPPESPLNLVADFGGGGMLAAVGALAALLERERSGLGQVVDAAMTDAVGLLMATLRGMRAGGQWTDRRGDNLLDGGAPFYHSYETADAKFVSVAALEAGQYVELLRVCGLDAEGHLAASQQDRSGWPEVQARFAAKFSERTRDEWCDAFAGVDTSFAPVLTMDETTAHDYHRERGSYLQRDGAFHPTPAPRFSRTPSEIGTPPPPK
jgi:alpha-methylacyl-CoA racemase